jgi:cell division GTPase FtsZ
MTQQQIEQILNQFLPDANYNDINNAAAAISEALEKEKKENFPLFEQTKKKLNTALFNCVARKELHLMEASHIMSVYANHAKPEPSPPTP